MTAVETAYVPAAAAVPPLSLADELDRLAPGWALADLCHWPADTFAFTATVLADSGAYRCVVSPPSGRTWPPEGGAAGWEDGLRRDAAAWADAAVSVDPQLPRLLLRLQDALMAAAGAPLDELDRPGGWPVLADLLHLHALADEACAGAGVRTETPFQQRAAHPLAATGSLARLAPDRARVLPKLRPPAAGITLRSLSHHVALRLRRQLRPFRCRHVAGASAAQAPSLVP